MNSRSLLSAIAICVLVSTSMLVPYEASAEGRHVAAARSKRPPPPKCRDRRDNDRDGLIDFPSDPGCRSRRDRSEKNASSGTPTDPGDPAAGIPALGAGASLNGKRVFPADNVWNQDVSGMEVDPNSDTLIATIGLDRTLHPDFGTFYEGGPIGIPYVVVPGDQAKVPVSFEYTGESDPGPYPIPADPPIEGGASSDGDRHILMIDRDNWKLYELFYAFNTARGWTAGSGAIFDLNSNQERPAGWTSADAAGLPIFPGLARYDEIVERGELTHALRFTTSQTRRAYVPPARHYASSLTDARFPPMGMRVRLKADVDISSYSPVAQVVLRGLKKYGMILADNGSNWYISGAHDPRWDDDALGSLKRMRGRDFEVVKMGELTR